LHLRAAHAAWEPSAEGGVLQLRQGDRNLTVRAWAALDCSGRAAAIARRLATRRLRRDRLVAVAALCTSGSGEDVDSTTLVEAVSDGWWYTALLPEKRRIFCLPN
jgi:hypothetical protein